MSCNQWGSSGRNRGAWAPGGAGVRQSWFGDMEPTALGREACLLSPLDLRERCGARVHDLWRGGLGGSPCRFCCFPKHSLPPYQPSPPSALPILSGLILNLGLKGIY